jgi:Mrp family chromosome partitioning ATPase
MSDHSDNYEILERSENGDESPLDAELSFGGSGVQSHVQKEHPANKNVVAGDRIFSEPILLPAFAPQSPNEFSLLHSSLETRLRDSFQFDLDADLVSLNGNGFLLGVCSAIPGEGKTTNAFHLAHTIARDSFADVCLMDLALSADPGSDLVHQSGLFSSKTDLQTWAFNDGVADFLQESATCVSTLSLDGLPKFVIAPAGSIPNHPARLCRSVHLERLFREAKKRFTITLVDLPALSTGFAMPLMRHLDGVLLVAQYGVTTYRMADNAVTTIGKDKVVGIIINRFKVSAPNWITKRFFY